MAKLSREQEKAIFAKGAVTITTFKNRVKLEAPVKQKDELMAEWDRLNKEGYVAESVMGDGDYSSVVLKKSAKPDVVKQIYSL